MILPSSARDEKKTAPRPGGTDEKGQQIKQARSHVNYLQRPVTVHLKEVDPNAWKLALECIYTSEIKSFGKDPPKMLLALLDLGQKYGIRILTSTCERALSTALTSRQALKLFATHYKQLTDIRVVMESELQDLLNTKEFMDLSHDALLDLVSSDDINVQEFDLLKAIDQWAQGKCAAANVEPTAENRRGQLKGVLKNVRFPTFTGERLAEIRKMGLLTDDQLLLIFQWIARRTDGAKSITRRDLVTMFDSFVEGLPNGRGSFPWSVLPRANQLI